MFGFIELIYEFNFLIDSFTSHILMMLLLTATYVPFVTNRYLLKLRLSALLNRSESFNKSAIAQDEVMRINTPYIPYKKSLIIRSNGDEASGLLRTAQFSSWISRVLIDSYIEIARFVFAPLLIVGITIDIISNATSSYQYAEFVRNILSSVLPLILIASAVLSLLAIAFSIVSKLPFGADFLSWGVDLSVTAEDIPSHLSHAALIPVEFGSRSRLAHSQIYENSAVLSLISSWIVDRHRQVKGTSTESSLLGDGPFCSLSRHNDPKKKSEFTPPRVLMLAWFLLLSLAVALVVNAIQERVWALRNAPLPATATSGVFFRPELLSVFRDCNNCPEMVALPTGSYTMGSPLSESGRGVDEGPQHEVEVRSFALGSYEVTFREWDTCYVAGGCSHKANDLGTPRDRGKLPVVNVGWHDAQEYVNWLTDLTGKNYRLPSEAEWEYAARAGTTTRFWFGDEATKTHMDFTYLPWFERLQNEEAGTPLDSKSDSRGYEQLYEPSPQEISEEQRGRLSIVGSYPANPWGLHDMNGNVEEWVEDKYHESYNDTLPNASDSTAEVGTYRVLRGGSYGQFPDNLRSASRESRPSNFRHGWVGFRVARDLPDRP